mmetsp:Transcript_1809/g.5582  ORF Transcript_1809/g.5582 Transcript_1809/m.5582 type:complete len:236 (+) Transcript_1809:394-1101(+)
MRRRFLCTCTCAVRCAGDEMHVFARHMEHSRSRLAVTPSCSCHEYGSNRQADDTHDDENQGRGSRVQGWHRAPSHAGGARSAFSAQANGHTLTHGAPQSGMELLLLRPHCGLPVGAPVDSVDVAEVVVVAAEARRHLLFLPSAHGPALVIPHLLVASRGAKVGSAVAPVALEAEELEADTRLAARGRGVQCAHVHLEVSEQVIPEAPHEVHCQHWTRRGRSPRVRSLPERSRRRA